MVEILAAVTKPRAEFNFRCICNRIRTEGHRRTLAG
jgi:hypothetical protein